MNRWGLVAALAALGVGGWSLMGLRERDDRIEALERSVREMSGSVTGLDARLERILQSDGHAPAPLGASAARDGSGVGEAAGGLATRPLPSTDERLAALEETLAAQRETIAALEKEKAETTGAFEVARGAMRDRFYFNLESAAKSLGLSERQKADMKERIAVAKRDLEELYATPNDEGQTWKELRQPRAATLASDSGGLTIAMPDFRKIEAHKRSRIPGSSETFGEADRRVRDRALGGMREGLTPEQATKWDKANKDNLLGPSSGASFASITVGGLSTSSEDDR